MTECGVVKYEIDLSLQDMMVTCLIDENYRDTLTGPINCKSVWYKEKTNFTLKKET